MFTGMELVAIGALVVVVGYVVLLVWMAFTGRLEFPDSAKTTTPPDTRTLIRPEIPTCSTRGIPLPTNQIEEFRHDQTLV